MENSKLPPELLTPEKLVELKREFESMVTFPDPDDVKKIKVLPIDKDGTDEENHIKDEIHIVDVPNSRQVIQLDAGSFYTHDLKIVVKSTGEELKINDDFIIVGMNYGKTKITRSKHPIYDFLFIIAPVVGEVLISYRAFGGRVSELNIEAIKAILIEILVAIKNGKFVTCETLKNCPFIKELKKQIEKNAEDIKKIQNITKNAYAEITDDLLANGKFFLIHDLDEQHKLVPELYNDNNERSFQDISFPSRNQCIVDFSEYLKIVPGGKLKGTYRLIVYKSILTKPEKKPDPGIKVYKQQFTKEELIAGRIDIFHKLVGRNNLLVSVKDNSTNMEIKPDIHYYDDEHLILDFNKLVDKLPRHGVLNVIVINFTI